MTCKWQVKVRSKVEVNWAHFSYIPQELKDEFQKSTEYRGWNNNDWLDKWSMADFGIRRIDTWDDLNLLKKSIRDKYKKIYPELFVFEEEGKGDHMGWTRLWLVTKMQEEIEKCRV